MNGDPYNYDGPSNSLQAAMERVWKALCDDTTSKPDMIWLCPESAHALGFPGYEDLGHVMYPYGDVWPSMFDWWKR